MVGGRRVFLRRAISVRTHLAGRWFDHDGRRFVNRNVERLERADGRFHLHGRPNDRGSAACREQVVDRLVRQRLEQDHAARFFGKLIGRRLG